MDLDDLALTGTCDLSTRGRRSGRWRRVEIWYVIVEGQIVVTGTPGAGTGWPTCARTLWLSCTCGTRTATWR